MAQVWGHRGAGGQAPENTLPAFELAARQGAHGIELDVRRCADGQLVVCHDETVDRTSDGTGRIAELTWNQLRRFDFGGGAQVPALAEVLDLAAGTGMRVNVELKNTAQPSPGMEAEVEAIVQASRLAADATERVVYSSFDHRSLVRLVQLGTRVPVGVLYVEPLIRPWVYAAGFGAGALHPMAVTVLADEVAQAHAAGLRVHAWTVDDPVQARALAAAGVDAVITNHPDRILAALGERARRADVRDVSGPSRMPPAPEHGWLGR